MALPPACLQPRACPSVCWVSVLRAHGGCRGGQRHSAPYWFRHLGMLRSAEGILPSQPHPSSVLCLCCQLSSAGHPFGSTLLSSLVSSVNQLPNLTTSSSALSPVSRCISDTPRRPQGQPFFIGELSPLSTWPACLSLSMGADLCAFPCSHPQSSPLQPCF